MYVLSTLNPWTVNTLVLFYSTYTVHTFEREEDIEPFKRIEYSREGTVLGYLLGTALSLYRHVCHPASTYISAASAMHDPQGRLSLTV